MISSVLHDMYAYFQIQICLILLIFYSNSHSDGRSIEHFPSDISLSNIGRSRFNSALTDDNTYATNNTTTQNNTHNNTPNTHNNAHNNNSHSAVNNIQNYSEYYTPKLSESPNHKNAVKRMKQRVSSRAPGVSSKSNENSFESGQNSLNNSIHNR
jgi:hypothetical protein